MQYLIEYNKIMILAALLTLWNLFGLYIVIQNIVIQNVPNFVA